MAQRLAVWQLRYLLQERRWAPPNLKNLLADPTYVAFVDLLGFAHAVESDFQKAVRVYDDIFAKLRLLWPRVFRTLRLSVASDSIVLTSPHLAEVGRACNLIQMMTLYHDVLCRGGIAYGPHVQASRRDQFYVVSPALVAAVRVEKAVSNPCIALDPSAVVPYDPPGLPPQTHFERLFLFFRQQWIVNPFSMSWGASGATRVEQLASVHPEHAAKYSYFLDLYSAVRDGKRLLPGTDDNGS